VDLIFLYHFIAYLNVSIFFDHVYSTLLEFVWLTHILCMLYGALQLGLSDLNLVYACSRDKTLMIDVQAREITERDLQAGMKLAHSEVFSFVFCFLIYCKHILMCSLLCSGN